MNRFSEIILALDVFKTKVDDCITRYKEKEAEDKDIYNSQTLALRHADNIGKLCGEIQFIRDDTGQRINSIIDDIQDNLKKWSSKPIPEGQLNLICTLLSSGVQMSGGEIEALRESVSGNYFADKMVCELATRNGLQMYFRPKNSIDTYVETIKRVVNEADIFIRGYCGTKPNSEILPEGISKHIMNVAATCRPFKPDSNILAAAAIWSGADIPKDKKTRLTADDTEILDKMYSGCTSPNQKVQRTQEILHSNPAMKEILMLSAEYSQYVPAENPEGVA